MTAALAFNAERHEYSVGDRRLCGVTEALPSPPGLERASLYDVQRKQAIGSATHLAALFDLRGTLDEATLDDEVVPYFNAWRAFLYDTGFAPILDLVERPLLSSLYQYAGTPDVPGILNGRVVVPDLKTCVAKPGRVTALQTAAYAQLLHEARPRLFSKLAPRFALWLDPSRSPPYVLVPYHDPNDFATFLCFLRCHQWRRANGYDNGELAA